MRKRLILSVLTFLPVCLFMVSCEKEKADVPQMPSFIELSLAQPYSVENGSRFEISVAEQDDAVSFLWELPDALQLIEGNGTSSIIVKCVKEGEIAPGSIKVYAVNANGQSNQRAFWFSIEVTPRIIAIKTDIEGSQAIEPLSSIAFIAPELDDIVSYRWNCPEGFTAESELDKATAWFRATATPRTVARNTFELHVTDADGMESVFYYEKYLHIIDIALAKRYGKKVWTLKNLNNAGEDGNLGKTHPDDHTGEKYGRYYMWGDAMTGESGRAEYYTDGDTVTDDEGHTFVVGYADRKDFGIQIQGACPEGWHVPNAYDFYDLPDAVADDYNVRMNSIGDCASSRMGIFMPSNRETDPMKAMNMVTNGFASSYLRGSRPQSDGGQWERNESTITEDGYYFYTTGTGAFPAANNYPLYLDLDGKVGFNVLPCGRLESNGSPSNFGKYSFMWTATVTSGKHYRFTVGFNTANLSTYAEKGPYESLRCVANY